MLFYLSCTGNTRWLAHELGRATGERVVDMARAMRSNGADAPDATSAPNDGTAHAQSEGETYTLAEGERLGFCFPVHGWRPPFLVRQFVRQLRITNAEGHYTYAFATCGDDVGLTFDYLQHDLHAAGLHADSVFSIIMPESYLFPIVDAIDRPDVAEQKKAHARELLPTLLPYIKERARGGRHINRSRWPRTNSRMLGSLFLRWWVTDKPFGVAADRCRRCGLCARVCPTGNIDSSDGTPRWLHTGRCLTCFACYHHCPAHAVTYGWRTPQTHRQYYFDKTR